MQKYLAILCTLLLCATYGIAQPTEGEQLEMELKQHVQILASDEMEGRATGSKGEEMAAAYIIEHFEELGLKAMGDGGTYLQAFEAFAGKDFGPDNSLKIRAGRHSVKTDFYPLEMSANGSAFGKLVYLNQGIYAPKEGFDDYAGKKVSGSVVVIEVRSPKVDNPHSGLAQQVSLRSKAEQAAERGARGVIFINSSEDVENPVADYSKKMVSAGIPVIFCKKANAVKSSIGKKAKMSVDLISDVRTGHNVIGMLDKGADNYIIIGGHYDHLGYGDFGSRHLGKNKEVHNGADDNASGISVILEVAEKLHDNSDLNFNILFIAFSGEEMGLLGSKFYVENPTVELEDAVCMLNLDMVGRMNNRTLVVNGTGTAPEWGNLLQKAVPGSWKLNLAANESGIGPSDHTSFYLKDIPVLALFTGTHQDYHRPEDDADKLNYYGMKLITDFVVRLVEEVSDAGTLTFTKTKDKQQNAGRQRFKVTLGVLPSYSYQGGGMLIDGVSDGNPAQKAGLEGGDIIIGLGDKEIKDIYGYMEALGGFSKGDKTKVKVKRGEEELEFDIEF